MGTFGAAVLVSLFLNAKEFTLNQDYESSVVILNMIHPTRQIYNEYYYLQAVNYHQLNKGKEAAKNAQFLVDSFEQIERRHEIIAEIILRDVKNWKDGDLSDIDRDMRRSVDKLANSKSKQAEKPQKDVIDKLDKLIKDIEDAEANAKAEPQYAGKGKPENKSQKPADDSEIMDSLGKGITDQKVLQNIKDMWGKLPDSERKQIKQAMDTMVPDKFKSMVEAYKKSLNEVKQDK